MLKGLPRNVVVLGIVSALNDMASEIAIRTIPLFLNKVLGVKTGLIGLIEGLAETTATLLKLASGILSDKLGKRKPVTLFRFALSNLMKALLVDLAPPEFKGTTFVYFQVAVGAAALPASLITGLVWQALGSKAAFIAGGSFAVLGTLLLLLVRDLPAQMAKKSTEAAT